MILAITVDVSFPSHFLLRQIDFDRTGNYIFGLKFQSKKFVPASQIRLWKVRGFQRERAFFLN